MAGAAARVRPTSGDGSLRWERRHLVPLLVLAFGGAPLLAVAATVLPEAYDRALAGAALLLVIVGGLAARGLVLFVRGLVRREQVLRDASTALSAATDRAGVTAATLDALLELTDPREARAWFIGQTWTRGVVTARCSDDTDVPMRGEELHSGTSADRVEPHVVVPGSPVHRALGLEERRPLVVVPMHTQGSPRALALVSLPSAPRVAVLRALHTLADTVSLALDRLDLAAVQVEQRSERRLRSMVAHATDVICLLDGDLTVLYVTPAAQDVLGIAPLELVGQSWLELVDDADRASAHDLMLRASRGRPATAELRLLAADGRERVVDTTVTEVDDELHAGFVLTCHDVTQRRSLEQQLAHQAFHDALTGLANRALFQDRVDHALRRIRRSGGACAVLFIDLDDFKTVNDSLGHAAGDALLAEVTTRLRRVLNEGDTAARLGGDEFAVLLEDCDEQATTELADELIEVLSVAHPVAGTDVVPHASIGIAIGGAGDGVGSGSSAAAGAGELTTDDLLRNADLALYEAKNGGKSRWRLFAPAMHDLAVERLELTNELRHALTAGEITVHYQPVVALASSDIVAFEALARWEHPSRGMLLPGRFIPIAEDTGLIGALGRRVLDIALADAARWQQLPGREELRIAVNISGRQLQDPQIVTDVRTLLDRHRVSPGTLILEFTESVLLPGDTATLERIEALSQLGVRLYIDDFGTGYSSLSYLQQLPVDGMKLAQEFVRGLPGTAGDSSLVRAILDLAASLGLDAVIAEGVERGEQRESLVALGYGMAQGFHLGTPQPADKVDRLLDRRATPASTR